MKPEEVLACQIGVFDVAERERHEIVLGQLSSSVQDIEELPDGYALRFEAAECLLVAEFIARERLCCPFFHFIMDVEPHGGPLWLRLTGQPGVKQFLQEELSLPD
ncbi:MAG: hypothetical protein M3Z24_06240 [Chloroflexota bacterium]|nr:hypothetical protein [Chloroflexota bacterium]